MIKTVSEKYFGTSENGLEISVFYDPGDEALRRPRGYYCTLRPCQKVTRNGMTTYTVTVSHPGKRIFLFPVTRRSKNQDDRAHSGCAHGGVYYADILRRARELGHDCEKYPITM